MNGSRKLLLLIITLAVLADFLPATRQEFAWWWAESRDHSADYQRYLSDWKTGRHADEAKLRIQERQHAEYTRAQIRLAIAEASHTRAETDAAYQRDLRNRQESFFWKQAAAANSIERYNDYLRKFPQGKYSAEARLKIAALGQPGQSQ